MTLRVVCGAGHINEYNLTIIPRSCWIGDKNGGHSATWDWDRWRCKEEGCAHPEYVNHVLDNEYTVPDTSRKNGMMMAFMLLALFLSRKTIGVM